jgi:hypothetical protein
MAKFPCKSDAAAIRYRRSSRCSSGLAHQLNGTVLNPGSTIVSGSFAEKLLLQTIIIRTNKVLFLQSWLPWPLLAWSGIIMAIGILILFSPVGGYLGFIPFPTMSWPLPAISRLRHILLTHVVRMWLLKRAYI